MESKDKHAYCVIMAGGIGSRFWPLSRENTPKQFIDALGMGKTFIQQTYERFARFIPTENFLVVTSESYKTLVLEQLPMLAESQVLTEPCRRNTAPCIAYAAYHIAAHDRDAVMVVTPSDHFIGRVDRFEEVIRMDLDYAARHDALMTVGISPSFPATEYGYIQVADRTQPISPVKAFKEKPDLETAVRFLSQGDYVWNSGMFVWSVQAIQRELERQLPDIAEAFARLTPVYGSPQERAEVDAAYQACRSISIDYGVMEGAEQVMVSCADFGWSDLGSWNSLYNELPKTADKNACSGGDVLCCHTSGTLIKETNSDKLVVVSNLTDFIVADTDDVLMICPRGSEQEIKGLIAESVQHRADKK